jgi:PhnB protein
VARLDGIGRGLRNRVGFIFLYVENVDALANQAIAAGAKVLMAVPDQFRGDRYGKLANPFEGFVC